MKDGVQPRIFADMSVTRRELLSSSMAAVAVSVVCAPAFALADRFSADQRSKRRVDHSAWTGLLGTYAETGGDGIVRLRYRDFRASGRKQLSAYLSGLRSVPVTGLNKAEQFAFWVNLYNAQTIDIVLRHYPVNSIRDINLGGGFFAPGPWKKKIVAIGAMKLSLDNIEHDILRPTFRDPRLHYVVNCASIGCPNLPLRALTGKTAATAIDKAARAYINHPRGVRVDRQKITASKLYQWYGKDFGGRRGVREHWRSYAQSPLAERLDQASDNVGFAYDWRLNDVG